MFQGFRVELMARNLALGEPELTIHIEYAISKELREDRLETATFNIVREVGPQEMLKVGRVSCANSMREA